jgi:hypothetical protein
MMRDLMPDEPDQRSELDNFLVVLRKVQRQAPDPATIKSAVAACKQISAMIRKGTAGEAHLRIREQLEERLAEI